MAPISFPFPCSFQPPLEMTHQFELLLPPLRCSLSFLLCVCVWGGAARNRTWDLMHARQISLLLQNSNFLSYRDIIQW